MGMLNIWNNAISRGGDPFQPLFDKYGVPPLAYSFRKLRSDYTGNAFIVKRDAGDNQAIGWVNDATSGYEIADQAAIAAFCGSGQGTVRVLHNQGSLGSDWDLNGGGVPQSPLVYNNGPLLVGGRMFMDFIVNQQRSIFVNAASSLNINELTVFMRYSSLNVDGTSRRVFALHNDNYFNGSMIAVARNTGTTSFSQRYPEPQVASSVTGIPLTVHTYFGRKTPSLIEIGIDGASPTTNNTATDNFNVGSFRLGGAESGGSGFEFNGAILEWIAYDTDKIADRAGIESDMSDFYT